MKKSRVDDIMESEEDYRIVISGWWVHTPELNMNLHEGVFCNYDEEEKEYLPDFSLTVIMEADMEKKEGEWLYYEQDGFEITLANYFSGKMAMEAISELSCFICIPDDVDMSKYLLFGVYLIVMYSYFVCPLF